MTKKYNPAKDVDHLEHVLNKWWYGIQKPTTNQCVEAEEAIKRLREYVAARETTENPGRQG